MNRKISDNEFRESLDRRLSPLRPDPWMAQKVHSRARQKEGEPVKKRLSVGTVLVLVILLLSVSAGIATVSGWDVVRFLYGGRNIPMPEVDVFPVHQEVSSDGALFRVESAVYDGKNLSFDCHFENLKPESPIFATIDEFTVNGISVSDWQLENFCEQWTPGIYSKENYLRGGESMLLPEELQDAEILHVYMKVMAYRPTRPVYDMEYHLDGSYIYEPEEFDQEEVAAKIEEGYFVIVNGDGYVGWDSCDNRWHICYRTEDPEFLSEEALEISFDVEKGAISHLILEPQSSYENEHGSVSYDVAAVTEGLHLTLRMFPRDDAFSRMQGLVLTDGNGVPLEGDRFTPDVTYRVDTGDPEIVWRYRWSRVRQKDLPDTISLTCILEDGEKLVFPVKVR